MVIWWKNQKSLFSIFHFLTAYISSSKWSYQWKKFYHGSKGVLWSSSSGVFSAIWCVSQAIRIGKLSYLVKARDRGTGENRQVYHLNLFELVFFCQNTPNERKRLFSIGDNHISLSAVYMVCGFRLLLRNIYIGLLFRNLFSGKVNTHNNNVSEGRKHKHKHN